MLSTTTIATALSPTSPRKPGVAAGGYGQGVAVGDYDGDGFPDLYVTQYGHSILYHNNGDGTFTDVTEKAGVAAPGWASSAVWFDYDNDGRLDLFVCRFVDFDKAKKQDCRNLAKTPARLLHPHLYKPMPSWLFHNNGDGTFTDVSKSSGIANVSGQGLGRGGDRHQQRRPWTCSSPTTPSRIFCSSIAATESSRKSATQAGVAYSADGRAAFRHGRSIRLTINEDGWMDLFVANVDHEMYSLYHNNHDETFDDRRWPPASARPPA